MASPEKYNADTSKSGFKDRDMQVVIGWVLRLGVTISMLIVVFGGAVFIYRHGHSTTDYTAFKGVPGFVHINGIIDGILAHRGQAVIQAGIILLIATPVLRVAFSAIGFILEKDYLYTAISLVVLLVIFFSIVSGHAG